MSQFAHSRLPTRRVAHPHTHGGVRNAIISVPAAAKKRIAIAGLCSLKPSPSHFTYHILHFRIKQLSDSLKPSHSHARCRSLASGPLLGIRALFIQHSLRFLRIFETMFLEDFLSQYPGGSKITPISSSRIRCFRAWGTPSLFLVWVL